MTTIYVTRSEQLAAQAIVERAARFGRSVDRATVLIANARPADKSSVPETASTTSEH